MPNGYFDLTGFDKMGDNDILKTNINEASEFAPQSYAQTGADNGVPDPKVPTPAETKATLADGEKGPTIPQNTTQPGETEPKKPTSGGETGPSIPKGTEITVEDWQASMRALQQSFKEGIELMQMLESCRIVDKTPGQRQQEYMENAMFEAMFAAYEDGPLFEAVKASDKDDIKKLVRALRPKLKNELKGNGLYFYDAKASTRTLSAALTAAASLGVTAAGYAVGPVAGALTGAIADSATGSSVASLFQQLWTTRLWQVLGIVHIEEGNITSVMNDLNEKYKDELGEYKIIHATAYPTIVDAFKSKFNWKNTKNSYFLLVDKKLPKEVKDAIGAMDKAFKAAEENKGKEGDGEKGEKKDGKCPKCGKDPCECDKK